MGSLTHEEAHRIVRERGVNKVAYRIMWVIIVPLLRLVFGMRVSGVENVPKTGAAVIVPNHKSFWDSFFIAAVLTRPVQFMGKAELFKGWRGRLFLALGAFPVQRGMSDEEALETARAILRRGELLSLFPEGTRVPNPDELGAPKRGAARLAIEAGAPLIPAAITGTEKRRFHLPRRVQVSFAEPIPVSHLEATPEAAADVINNAVWPTVTEEYHRLKSRKGLIAAGVAAAGLAVAVQRRRGR